MKELHEVIQQKRNGKIFDQKQQQNKTKAPKKP